MTFDDPAEAATYSKKLTAQLKEKLCVKPVLDEAWTFREKKRFATGEYRGLPWVGQNWWDSDSAHAIWKDHYPHAALEKPGWIAYTKNAEDGSKDKQSLLRPGAYLNRYFEKVLFDYGISQAGLVESFMKMYGPIDIKFATTADEMVSVYDFLHTCLYGRDWPKGIHPVTVYAGHDLQVAYIGDLNTGKISARSIVWPAKKLHSRVYGDIARLQSGLERLGYKWGAPIGAKIKRIQLRPPKMMDGEIPQGCFLVPYIDKKNQQGGGHLGVLDRDDHLEICEDNVPGSHHCGLPDGRSGQYVPRADERPKFYCGRCENQYDEVHTVYHYDPDNDDEEADAEELSWCNGCVARHTFTCGYSGYFFTEDSPSVEVGGDLWSHRYADMYAVRCEGNGRLYNKKKIVIVHEDNLARRYSNDHINAVGRVFQSGISNRFYWIKERARFIGPYGDEHYCSKDELRIHTFECDGCGKHPQIQFRMQWNGEDRLLCPTCEYEARVGKNLPVSPARKKFEKNRELRALPQLSLEAAE
jgi:hypothetical protein